jgi:hypothetical protein
MSNQALVTRQYHREYRALARQYREWALESCSITRMVLDIQADRWEAKADETTHQETTS